MPRLCTLGTGNAFADDARGFSALWVEPGGLLIDPGPGVLPALRRAGLSPDAIDRVVLTHLHGDHTAGWPFLALELGLRLGRIRPMHLFGPAGSRATLQGLLELCYDGVPGPTFESVWTELPVEERSGIDLGAGIRADVLPMRHHATSLGWRLELGGRRLAVSGDTGWCPALEALADGCDLLVLECTSVEPATQLHVSLAELRAQASRLRCEQVLLVHLTDAVALELAADPIPRVLAAHDGFVFDF